MWRKFFLPRDLLESDGGFNQGEVSVILLPLLKITFTIERSRSFWEKKGYNLWKGTVTNLSENF